MATLRIRTNTPTRKRTVECPTPQTAAETIDFRRLRLLHTRWKLQQRGQDPENALTLTPVQLEE